MYTYLCVERLVCRTHRRAACTSNEQVLRRRPGTRGGAVVSLLLLLTIPGPAPAGPKHSTPEPCRAAGERYAGGPSAW
jgi:hypothetical protein|eukprot:COSAG01_NODE_1957_length_8805_cov_22.976344_5_plen_78_part_00